MKTEISLTPGALLAGGLARRVGGGDKPMRQIAGRTILDRVIAGWGRARRIVRANLYNVVHGVERQSR